MASSFVSTLTPLPKAVDFSNSAGRSLTANRNGANENEILLIISIQRGNYRFSKGYETHFLLYNIKSDTYENISNESNIDSSSKNYIYFSNIVPINVNNTRDAQNCNDSSVPESNLLKDSTMVIANWKLSSYKYPNKLHLFSKLTDIKEKISYKKMFGENENSNKNDKSGIEIRAHGNGNRCIVYKNWLFISGGVLSENVITIYDLNQIFNHNNKDSKEKLSIIKRIEIDKTYLDHGFILKSVKESINTAIDNDTCTNKVDRNHDDMYCNKQIDFELLIFGGHGYHDYDTWVKDSFLTIEIAIKINDKECSCDDIENKYNVTYLCKDNKYAFGKNLDKALMFTFESPGAGNYGYFYLKQRYLIIIAPNDENLSDRIIYFDFVSCQWFMVNFKLPTRIASESAFVLSKNETFIDIFGFTNYKDDVTNKEKQRNVHYRLYIIANISWDLERLIWIGFYKNDKNSNCYIQLLPKDVVKYALSFVNGYCLMDQV